MRDVTLEAWNAGSKYSLDMTDECLVEGHIIELHNPQKKFGHLNEQHHQHTFLGGHLNEGHHP